MDEKQTPSPQRILETINAFHKTEILKAGVQLDIFSAIGNQKRTATEIASICKISERGARILCDALVVLGFLTKEAMQYGLTADSSFFLSKQSPSYIGGMIDFPTNPILREAYQNLTSAAREGRTTLPNEG